MISIIGELQAQLMNVVCIVYARASAREWEREREILSSNIRCIEKLIRYSIITQRSRNLYIIQLNLLYSNFILYILFFLFIFCFFLCCCIQIRVQSSVHQWSSIDTQIIPKACTSSCLLMQQLHRDFDRTALSAKFLNPNSLLFFYFLL